eukprot:9477854-Ditylum_brightwellii.AAC.1
MAAATRHIFVVQESRDSSSLGSGQQLICSKTCQCQNDDGNALQFNSKRNDGATMPVPLALSSAVDV